MTSAAFSCTLEVPDSGITIGRVYSLLLEEGVSAPCRAVVRFPDYEGDVLPQQLAGLKAVVKLTRGQEETSFTGVLTSLVLESGRDARSVYVAEVVDPFFASGSSRSYRVFEQRDIKSIVSSVLQRSNISVKFEAEALVYPICVQYGESDFSFISRLLEENGLYSLTDGPSLYVGGDSTGVTEPVVECSYRDVLESFQLRQEVLPLEKRGVSHVYEDEAWPVQVASNPKGLGAGWQASARLFGGRPDTELAEETSDDVLKRLAQIRSEGAALATCVGVGRSVQPAVRPGVIVRVSDAPRSEVGGEYFVWRVVHDFSASGSASDGDAGYGNSFWCVPKTVKYRPPQSHRPPKVFGVHVGTVVAPSSSDDSDGKSLGRVRVELPWMGQDDLCQGLSFWARVLEGHAGSDHGTVFIPELGDEVLVAFEGGNVNHPVVLGGLYTGKRLPPVPVPPGHENEQKIILTRSGNAILFEDLEDAKARLSVLQRDGQNKILMTIDGDKVSIEMSSKGSIRLAGKGSGEIVLSQGDGTIRIAADGSVEISGPKITVTGTKGDMVMKAPLIRIN